MEQSQSWETDIHTAAQETPIMEFKYSLLFSHKPTVGLYPELDECIPVSYIQFSSEPF
jgi:hypothetical protein